MTDSTLAPIHIAKLQAGYSGQSVLHDLDLVVQAGERVVLLGPNGAGKTTLLRCLLGLVRPSHGEVRLFGQNPADPTVRRELLVQVGTSLESPGLPAQTRPLEYLEHFARLSGVPQPRIAARNALRLWELPEQLDAQRLSLGQRQRLQVARSLIHSPRLALLDEPAANLDPSAQEAFWQLLDRYQADSGSTLVVSTHHLEEAFRHGPRWILINRGRILADGPPHQILEDAAGSRRLQVALPVRGTRLTEILAGLDVNVLGDQDRDDCLWRLVASNHPSHQARIVRALVAHLDVVGYGQDGTSLEESYRMLLGIAPTPENPHQFTVTQRLSAPHSLVAAWAATRLHGAGLARERRVLLPLVFLVAMLTASVLWALPDGLPAHDFYLPLLALAALLPAGLAAGIASDLIAGERERRSLETLLCAPASPQALFFGRALAIFLPALVLAWGAMLLVWGALTSRSLEPSTCATFAVALGFAPPAILLSLAVGTWMSARSRTVRAAAQMSALVTVPLVAASQTVALLTPSDWAAAYGWLAAGAVLAGICLPVGWRLHRRLRPQALLP